MDYRPSTSTRMTWCDLFFFVFFLLVQRSFPQSLLPDILRQSDGSYCSWSITSPSAIFGCSSHRSFLLHSIWPYDPRLCICNRLCFFGASPRTKLRPQFERTAMFRPAVSSFSTLTHSKSPVLNVSMAGEVVVSLRCCSGNQFRDHAQGIRPFLQVAKISIRSPAHLTSFIFA